MSMFTALRLALLALLLLAACSSPPLGRTESAPGLNAGAATPASAPLTAPTVPPSAPGGTTTTQAPRDGLEIGATPVIDLKVGTLPVAAYAPIYVALERGYFREVGLNVETVPAGGASELLPWLAQGQIHVGSCANSVACFNAVARGTDLQIVADLRSAGKTERSIGSTALVVRKDLWDAGTIRTARDLTGRTVYAPGGRGTGPWIDLVHWLRREGVAPDRVELSALSFPDQLAAMQNRGIEVGYQAEPLITTGVARDAHRVLATLEEMHPNAEILSLMYWSHIDRLGPMVGERFMVAYLRGARDYINAFEFGRDQDAIIGALVQHTTVKDAAVYRTTKYTWVDPNGVVDRASLEADVALLRDEGVLNASTNLAPAFTDHYRQFAVQYLGEYLPPG